MWIETLCTTQIGGIFGSSKHGGEREKGEGIEEVSNMTIHKTFSVRRIL